MSANEKYTKSNNPNTILSRVRWSMLLLLLGAMFLFMVPFSINIQEAYNAATISSDQIVTISFFGVFVLLPLSLIFSLNKYQVENNCLYVYSILGFRKRVICLEDIISWSEKDSIIQYKYTVYFEGKELILYLSRGKHKISSNFYTNYQDLKIVLIKGKSKVR